MKKKTLIKLNIFQLKYFQSKPVMYVVIKLWNLT